MLDATAVYDKWANYPGAPVKARADVDPDVPDLMVQIIDLMRVIDATNGVPDPWQSEGWGPTGCPE